MKTGKGNSKRRKAQKYSACTLRSRLSTGSYASTRSSIQMERTTLVTLEYYWTWIDSLHVSVYDSFSPHCELLSILYTIIKNVWRILVRELHGSNRPGVFENTTRMRHVNIVLLGILLRYISSTLNYQGQENWMDRIDSLMALRSLIL